MEIVTEKEGRVFRKYLIPSMLSMLAVSAYSFVDTFVVGRGLGANAVAAMGLGTPVLSILYALGFLLGAGGAVNYTVAKGNGDAQKANRVFSVAFGAALALWVLVGSCGNLWIEEFAGFLGATAGNRTLTVEYLRWILSLSGILVLDIVMNSFMRNEGHPNVSMVATLSGTGLNIVLDFLFVLGFDWGMGGAASATCLASVISVAINCSYAARHCTGLTPHPDFKAVKYLRSIVKIGFGSFVLEGAVAIISVVFLNYAGRHFGDAGVSAFSVIITLNLVVYSLLNGVAQAIQPLVSASFAAGKRERMRTFASYGLGTAAAMGALFCVGIALFPDFFAGLLISDSAEILSLASHGLVRHAPAFLFMAFSIVLGIYFQSETKPVEALVILLGRSAALPVCMLYLLCLFAGQGAMWIAIPAGEAIATGIALWLYLKEK